LQIQPHVCPSVTEIVNLKKQLALVQALQLTHLESPYLVRCGKQEQKLSSIIIIIIIIIIMDQDSVVGIATRYGLDSPRIEFRWGRDFPDHPASYTVGLSRGKAAEAWR
jgi:hypothetical protein